MNERHQRVCAYLPMIETVLNRSGCQDDDLRSDLQLKIVTALASPSFPYHETPYNQDAYMYVCLWNCVKEWMRRRKKKRSRVVLSTDLGDMVDGYRGGSPVTLPAIEVISEDMTCNPVVCIQREVDRKAAIEEFAIYSAAYDTPGNLSRKQWEINKARRDRLGLPR